MTGLNAATSIRRLRLLVPALVMGMAIGLAAIAYDVPLSAAPQAPSAEARPTPAASEAATEPAPRAVLQRYCFACHNQRTLTAGLALDVLDMTRVGEHAEVWEAVIRKLRTGAMPPVGRPRPDGATYDAVVTWIETELDRAALAGPDPGRPTLHRLNRTEYANAVRDLLAVDIDTALLPADNAAYGFDNNADALTLSSALTERYLGAAARIAEMALGRPRGTPAPETFFVPTDRDQGTRISDALPFGSRGGTAFRYYFPADGEYRFQMRPKESGVAGGFEGVTDEPHELHVGIDGERVWTGIVQRPPGVRGDERNRLILESMRFDAPVSAGSRLVQVYFAARTSAYVEDLFDPDLRRDPYRAPNGEPLVSSVAITGPLPDTVTVGESPSRRRLLVCLPATAADDEPCARDIVSTLARRAWRRPVSDGDLEIPLGLYRDGAARGGFEAGIELAVRGILVSPRFLFRFEDQPASVEPNTPYRISELELASRLSFFLWSSIPDDELLDLAVAEKLHDPDVLRQQVERMLADPRSRALVDNFAGQWLHIRNVAGFQPSPELLFHFDDNLRQAFEQETKLFFESIVRENRSVLDLLDTDYTFLNERLARHYGIPGVYGERFRRVSLPRDSVRRGLLGQGSILTGTSRANRTSPFGPGEHSRQVDPGEHPRHPAAPAAAQRPRPRGGARSAQGAPDARADGGAPGQPGLRGLPRADGPVGLRARELRRDRRVARHLCFGVADRRLGGVPRRHHVRRPGRAPRAAAEPRGRFPDDGGGPAADLRARARPRGDRHADRAADHARRRGRRLPFRGAGAGRRREHAVPDADGAGPGELARKPSPVAPISAQPGLPRSLPRFYGADS